MNLSYYFFLELPDSSLGSILFSSPLVFEWVYLEVWILVLIAILLVFEACEATAEPTRDEVFILERLDDYEDYTCWFFKITTVELMGSLSS